MQRKWEDPLEVFHSRCREHHLKVTPQRMVIFQELMSDRDHPCAERVFRRVRRRLQHISFDTVNRTLLKFAEIRLIDTVEGSGEPRRFDPDTSDHHHFLCTKCSEIIDVTGTDMREISVPHEIRSRCVVTNKRVVFQGICERCQDDRKTAESRVRD